MVKSTFKFRSISLGSYGLLFLALFLSFSLVRNVVSFTSAKRKLSQESEKITKLEKEVQILEEQVKSVKKEEFIEKEARDKLGLAKEGEIVVVLPEDTVLAQLAPKIPQADEFLPEPNWKKWLKLFL